MNFIKFFKKPPSSKIILTSHDYCLLQVRKYDRENYLAGLCINDAKIRRVNFALRAFNVELAIIRDKTSDSDRAKVRFHFWSKLIDEIIRRNDVTQQDLDQDKLNAYYNHSPIAKELLEIFNLVDLTPNNQAHLKDLIGSRLSSKVLGYKRFETMSELILYCSKSNESLYQLAWDTSRQIHNIWNPPEEFSDRLREISHHIGVAHGLSNVIRGIPYNASKGSCFVPNDLLKQFELEPADFASSIKRKELDGHRLKPVVKELAIRCQTYLDEAHSVIVYVPTPYRDIFLTRVAIQSFLRKLRLCHYDICDPKLNRAKSLLPLNLWLNQKYHRLFLR